MALSNQALALISISALLLSTFAVDAHLAASPFPPLDPSPHSYISSSPTTSPSPSPSPESLEEKDILFKYVEFSMQATMHKIDEFALELKKRMDDPETSSTTKECIQQCTEVYDSAKEDIVSSLKDMKCGDLYKANLDITSVSTDVDTCEQCFEEMIGEEPELKKFDDWVREVTEDALVTLEKLTS